MLKKLFCFVLFSPLLIFGQEFQIGDFHQGGFVFYIDTLGKGLLLDVAYLDANSEWDLTDSSISDWGPNLHYCSGTEHEFMGAGQFNTQNFTNDHPTGNYAANLCSNSSSGGYNDWFLPSKMELWKLMQSIAQIDSAISSYGGMNISEGFHWSSTQNTSDIRNAWGVIPFNSYLNGDPYGPLEAVRSKNTAHKVRAIRCIDNDCLFAATPIFGCTDTLATNFNIDAVVDNDSCEYVLGCIDVNSCNFDVLATQNNDSCEYTCLGCLDASASNWGGSIITIDDGSCLYCPTEYNSIHSTPNDSSDCLFWMLSPKGISTPIISGQGSSSDGLCLPDGCYTLTLFDNCAQDLTGTSFSVGDWSISLQENTSYCTASTDSFCASQGNCCQASIDFFIGNYDCDGNCIDANTNGICDESEIFECEDIYINLENGWNMIGFGCTENRDAEEAFTPIEDKIVIAKDILGNVYLPDFGFNGMGDLERGYGYLIKVTEEITNYSICD